jgi:hypothetical protein
VGYLRLTENILEKEWLNPQLFRFGASKLADIIFSLIKGVPITPEIDIDKY